MSMVMTNDVQSRGHWNENVKIVLGTRSLYDRVQRGLKSLRCGL